MKKLSDVPGSKSVAGRSFITYYLPLSVAAYAFIGSALSLIGWIFAIRRLVDWNNDGIEIKANTAIFVLAAALALLIAILAPKQKLLISALGLTVSALAALTLLQHLTGLNFGIDTIFITEPPGARATTSPGRMGLPASSSLTAIGLALVFSTIKGRYRRWASILATGALCISALSLVGYIFGANQLYSLPKFTGIALQTATMLAALGVGIAATVPEHGLVAAMVRKDAGGVMLRKLFLPLIVISLGLGWIRVMGQAAGLYDTEFGTALRTLVEIILLLGLLWWTANGISRSEGLAREATGALADRDERMHGVLESLSDAFVAFDSGFRFTYANATVLAFLAGNGIDVNNVVGQKVFDVLPEARQTTLGKALITSMAQRVPAELEDYFEPFDRWFHARFLPTRDGGLSMFALDVSEQKNSEQLVKRRANELSVLYGFADRLNQAVSIDEVYDAALDTITDALACDRASILLFDDEGVMRFVASCGLSDAYQTAVTGHSPWKQGETDARPMGVENIGEADIEEDLKAEIRGEGICALGFIPLIANETLIGKFMVYYDRPHDFSEAEFALAMTVGYQIAFGVERKRTEGALRENEERLRLATETGKVGVWDWEIREDRVSWTESVYDMHGVAPGGFDGRVESFADLVHPDDRAFVTRRIERALADEEPYEVEFRVALPNGGVNWLFTNARVLRDAEGPYRMIGATIDVTERKLAENRFAKLASIVESSRDAIISKDLKGVITSWNNGAERLFGYTSDEVVGRSITILIPPDRLNEEHDILARIGRGENIEHYETIRRHKDGTLLNISLTVSPLLDPAGKVIGGSKIARDITERMLAEAAIRDREIMHRLVEAQEADRHRIARDLHDHLGQQLTALRLKLESIRTLSGSDDALLKEVAETQEYASRIDLDINYLAWELRPTELDHLGLTDSLSSFVREWSKTYGIAAEFHTSKQNNGRYHAELETNLYRIVQEGLNNILKHAKATSVSVLLEQREDLIVLIIEDDGEGFEARTRPRNGSAGKGLGLIGMRERTALLGGTLEIESRPGGGTTIYARVPVRSADKNGG